MPVILATRDYARWLGERGHLRKNPGMNSVMTLGVVLAVFRFDAAVAQEGYLGQDHDKWHHSFYQTLERPDTKSPCCNLTDCRPTSGRQERKEKGVRATVEACQGQEAKSMGQTLVQQPVGCEIAGLPAD
jgi:hypothetical protein